MNLSVFTEAFAARLLPIYNEATLSAMRNFKLEEYPPHAVLAGVGGVLALGVYYLVGVWLRRAPERMSNEEQRARIEKMRKAASFWLPYLLVLSPTPVGGVVVMAAGFFRMKPALVMAIILLAEGVFRAMPYLR